MRRSFVRLAWALGPVWLAACGGPEPGVSAQGTPLAAAVAQTAGAGLPELRAGQLAAARSQFESALRADPDRMAALNDLALTYYLEGRFEAARQLLDEVVAKGASPEQQAALVNLAELYSLEGYLTAAQAHLESARAIDPARPEPVYATALFLDGRGDPDAARLVKDALRLDADGSARRALAFVYPEEKTHLDALVAEASGEREQAVSRWRELKAGRFPSLAQAAERHLEEEP
ncbi:MAG TPA: tetratricopeptide repeat protein [Anaeromyxobacteraceae bacterium]|nr:tetratricopeptide repeat protein [Anaeromyxobacteraceae bacterium]